MSEPKLPTLWVTEFGAEFLRKPSQYADNRSVSARTEAMPDGVPYVPAARLDAANLEIATLKAQVSSAVANLEEAQILFASIRQADALAPWACESEPGEESFDEQVREMLRDLEKITGFAARQRATLTPKEPSDG